jgi:N-acyl-D-amino-acid deacylase
MFDIIFKNGTVVDGSGKAGYQADVAVSKNKISKIGDLKQVKARIEIDAAGKIVSPGFIDIHNHSDSHWRIFLDPQLPSLLYQGITTIIGGNCGASIAPLTDGRIIESIQKWTDLKRVNVDWLSFSEFADKMSQRKIGVNFGTLVGHSTLRRGVILDGMRRLDQDELEVVEKMLKRSIKEGALGFSLGLAYSHERQAAWDELEEFAEITKSNKKVLAIHLRDEAGEIVEAVQEAIDLAKETGASLQISHLKVMGEKNWPLMDKALEMIEKAREAGANINFDVYPYTQTNSVLYSFLPAWAAEGGKKMLLSRMKDAPLRKKIAREMKETAQIHYEDAIIAMCGFSSSLANRKISEIAAQQGITAEDAIIDLLIASEGRVITLADCLDEENVKKAIRHPLSIIASDGSGYGKSFKESGELIHPRSFGTFPRVLGKYVREEKLLTLEEAVKKMTSKPAKKFGLNNRGTIEKGKIADLAVFDAEKISDRATVENPYQYSDGISEVVVNGRLAMQGGKLTGEMGGEFISG